MLVVEFLAFARIFALIFAAWFAVIGWKLFQAPTRQA